MATKLVAFKATPTEVEAMEQLVSMGYYRSTSTLLREAVMLLLRQHNVKLEALTDIRLERIRHTMRRRKRANDVAEPDDDD